MLPPQLGEASGLIEKFEIKEHLPTQMIDSSIMHLENTISQISQKHDEFAFLHLKQAMASLKMLKASINEWNLSKNHLDLVTWSAWSLQQLQESLENVLRAIAEITKTPVTSSHELEKISTDLNVEMGKLGQDLNCLSWKPRYPAKFRDVEGKSAKIIDFVESLRLHPELDEGFQVTKNPLSTRLWEVIPNQEVTTQIIGKDLLDVLNRGTDFLNQQLASIKFINS
jgi:hypothetical protein